MLTATCLCGACHLTILEQERTIICHCLTCRKLTSTAFSMGTVVTNTSFNLERGEPKQRSIVGGSGASMTLSHCGDCGCHLWVEWPLLPQKKVVCSGAIDGGDAFELEEIRPCAEVWVKRRPSWLCALEGAAQWDENVKR
ncbi:hypothetical protein D0860_04512 [Hortaea werneckii]|uniref:CENP-V/GFA domain-containing protein n=1 Tax=Hortaea werneckii TaxID=91943 RepID=A0A3M7I8Y3_HORWE|nr:hypothetical protein D0860_04512 [Hortaea werneckii]RMZ21964.1 hypothetical protein D0859_14024 [Hortaea werneckii]